MVAIRLLLLSTRKSRVECECIDLGKPKSGAPQLSPCILLDNTIFVMSAN